MNESLTKKLYNIYDVQGVGIDALNAALDYISDMFRYIGAGMTSEYIRESIDELTTVIFKSAGKKYLKSIQPADETAERIKDLKNVTRGNDLYVPDLDIAELKYLYGDIKEIRRKFSAFGIKIHTMRIFRTNTTLNHLYSEIQPNFADILPGEINHLDEYKNLFDLLDHTPPEYKTITDDPQIDERKADLNNFIFDRIDKPTYQPPTESAAAADLYDTMLKQTHLLIAGTTGSGKSFLIHRLIERLLKKDCSIILFDPKIVELIQYKECPNVDIYESDAAKIANILKFVCAGMKDAFNILAAAGLKETPAKHTYIIIDEFADLVNIPGNRTLSKEIFAYVQRIAQIGRAAGVHLIIATQRPTREIIPGAITGNLTAKIALRTASAQESRNIIGISGAEKFPRIGKAFYFSPDLLKPEIIDII